MTMSQAWRLAGKPHRPTLPLTTQTARPLLTLPNCLDHHPPNSQPLPWNHMLLWRDLVGYPSSREPPFSSLDRDRCSPL